MNKTKNSLKSLDSGRVERDLIEAGDLEIFRKQVNVIRQNLLRLLQTAKTQDDRDLVVLNLATAQENASNALSSLLDQGDVHVQQLEQEILDGQDQIDKLLKKEELTAEVLTAITSTVRAASALLALAA